MFLKTVATIGNTFNLIRFGFDILYLVGFVYILNVIQVTHFMYLIYYFA